MRSPSGKRDIVPGWSPGEIRSQTQRRTPKENEREHVERWTVLAERGTPGRAEKGDDQLTGHERLRES